MKKFEDSIIYQIGELYKKRGHSIEEKTVIVHESEDEVSVLIDSEKPYLDVEFFSLIDEAKNALKKVLEDFKLVKTGYIFDYYQMDWKRK